MAYTKDEIDYPSVTTILGVLDKGDALNYWAAGCAVEYIRAHIDIIHENDNHKINDMMSMAKKAFKEVSGEALTVGSIVHDMIEQYIKTGKAPDTDNDQAQNGFLAFLEWESKNHVRWIQSELDLFHEGLLYAGRTDAIAEVNGHLYLIDFKTSKGFYDDYKKQLAAYREAYNYSFGYSIENIGCLRLDKDTGECEWKDYTKGADKAFDAFTSLLGFYYKDKKRRLNNNPRAKEQY